jgi:hypothetical protein
MVRQIEIETRPEGRKSECSTAQKMGDVPCLFGTLTSQRYHWEDIIRIVAEVEGVEDCATLSQSKRRELVNKYPLFVSWYNAVRLELALKAVVVPHLAPARMSPSLSGPQLAVWFTYITSFGSAGRPASTYAPNAWSCTRR